MEKIFKRKDGSRVKVRARLSIEFIREQTHWSIGVEYCPAGKRTFNGCLDLEDWNLRSLSAEERTKYIRQQQLKHATKDEIYEVMLAEWESIKPTIDQI